MQDKKMFVATVAAIVGASMLFVSMLQTTPLTLRYASISVLIICEVVFLWSFLSLGARG
jgi:hypothetical protein